MEIACGLILVPRGLVGASPPASSCPILAAFDKFLEPIVPFLCFSLPVPLPCPAPAFVRVSFPEFVI